MLDEGDDLLDEGDDSLLAERRNSTDERELGEVRARFSGTDRSGRDVGILGQPLQCIVKYGVHLIWNAVRSTRSGFKLFAALRRCTRMGGEVWGN